MSMKIEPAAVIGPRLGDPLRRSSDATATAPADRETLAILRNPDFATLVRERTSFGWALSIAMLTVYLAFIFMVAFAQDLMATRVAGQVSLGILLGLCVIVFAILLTGLYVWRANGRFDDLTRSLRRSERR